MMDTTFNELSRLLKQPAFTTKEANKLGVSSSLLTYYYKTGKLDRLARGIYKSSDKKLIVPMEWEDVAIRELDEGQDFIKKFSKQIFRSTRS